MVFDLFWGKELSAILAIFRLLRHLWAFVAISATLYGQPPTTFTLVDFAHIFPSVFFSHPIRINIFFQLSGFLLKWTNVKIRIQKMFILYHFDRSLSQILLEYWNMLGKQ